MVLLSSLERNGQNKINREFSEMVGEFTSEIKGLRRDFRNLRVEVRTIQKEVTQNSSTIGQFKLFMGSAGAICLAFIAVIFSYLKDKFS